MLRCLNILYPLMRETLVVAGDNQDKTEAIAQSADTRSMT